MPQMSENDPRMPEKTHQRRVRYRGTHPRRFEEKYKELDPELDPATLEKIIASGDTPAGMHRPILVEEILEHLAPRPGQRGADVTLGYGGHAEHLLKAMGSDGQLLALDVDTRQLPITEARLRELGYGEASLIVRRSNYAGLARVLGDLSWTEGLDFVLADLGLSSMQIDNPARGFSYKSLGPLDMRMSSERGSPAKDWLAKVSVEKLTRVLVDGGDEPRAPEIAQMIKSAAQSAQMETTRQLRAVIHAALPDSVDEEEEKTTCARVFQAIRIAINDEFSALDSFLAQLPACLLPGGRVAILSFHSGEDRRVKHHFRNGLRDGLYSQVADALIRPTFAEKRTNLRASSAKMRWAIRA